MDREQYLFTLYKYIEMNPIKATIVRSLEGYPCSSYGNNAFGLEDELIVKHSLYLALGEYVDSRCEQYKALFEDIDISKQNERITQATLRGEVYGSSGFHQQIEKLISRPTVLSGHVDRKSQAYKNQVGRPLD